MHVVILAAGQGTRLRPLTHDRPKSMLQAGGRPILAHLMDALKAAGVKAATVVVGHGQERLRAFLGDGGAFGIKVTYVVQEKQLGPGNAANAAVADAKGDVAILPADAWYHPDLVKQLVTGKGPALVLVPDPRSRRFGVPVFKGDQVVDVIDGDGELVLGGASRLPVELLRRLPEVGFRLRDVIKESLPTSRIIRAKAGQYVDVIEAPDLLELNARLMDEVKDGRHGVIEKGAIVTGDVQVGEDTVIRAGTVVTGPAVIGKACTIGPHAVLLPGTSIRNHTVVAPFALIEGSIVGSNVSVGPQAVVRESIIDHGATLGAGAILDGAGVVVGADASIGARAVVQAGGRIGRRARVAEARAVETVPDEGVAV